MNDEKRCQGCGVLLQNENILQEGYTTNLENDICQRCFRMKNYGEYQVVTKSNEEYLKILRSVSETKDLVLYITDLLNLEKDLDEIRNMFTNKMILILNKKDVFPKSVKEEKLIKYLENKGVHLGSDYSVYFNSDINDKIGVYTIFKVLNDLANDENSYKLEDKFTLTILATTQEESGLRGAVRASRNINPDISIDLDVTHANDCKLFSGERFGDIKLGQGVVIEFGQDKSRRLANLFIDLAEKHDVKYQTGVARCGGTNTNAIELNTSDCETMLLSIPLLSMHTQNETMHWEDVNGTVELIKYYLKTFDTVEKGQWI
jgi:aspartyl aminopeptidase